MGAQIEAPGGQFGVGAASSLKLLAKEGPLRGQHVAVDREVVVGRENADVTIDDAQLSRRHALVRSVDGALEVEDLGSLNGTWVNGVRIQQRTRLNTSDLVKVGATVFEVFAEPSRVAVTVPSVQLHPIVAQDVARQYGQGETAVHALRGISLQISKGRLTAIMGPSGSGKSTLMHILAGLDEPTTGTVTISGVDITRLDDAALTKFRRERIGFIFQFFNLLPMLTVEENIALPLSIAGQKPDKALLDDLIERVGLSKRRKHRPSELSGGQQQRVAIARAFISQPAVVFADEPTGNLDSKTSGEILELMRDSVDSFDQTTVMVTHDANAAAIADRVLFLADGQIVKDLGSASASEVMAAMQELNIR